jgi:hypothetical protein
MSNSAITFGPSAITSNQITWSEPVAFRNKIINGNFDIWQRGTSFSVTSGNTYTADRWCRVFDGSGATRTVVRQNFAINQTEVSGAPKYFINSTQSVAGTGGTFNALVQRIESVRTFAGQTVTVSFWAKSSVGSFVQLSLGQRASTSVFRTVTSATLTSAWTKYTGTITLAAIGAGVTEDGNDHLEVAFNFNNNVTHNIDIAQVQIEAGSVATPFEQRPIGTELQLCQRYFAICGGGAVGIARSATDIKFFGTLPVQMRVAPIIGLAVTSNVGAEEVGFADRIATTATIILADFRDKTGWRAQIGGFSSLTFGSICNLGTNAISASAEL